MKRDQAAIDEATRRPAVTNDDAVRLQTLLVLLRIERLLERMDRRASRSTKQEAAP